MSMLLRASEIAIPYPFMLPMYNGELQRAICFRPPQSTIR
jgi:hypothetical protein